MKRNKLKISDQRKLIKRFCEIAHLDIEAFKGNTRRDRLPFLRYVFFYCIRKELTWLTFNEIGAILGKDHSTVIAGIKQVEATMNPPRPDKNTIDIIEAFSFVCEQYKILYKEEQLREQLHQPILKRCQFLFQSFSRWIRYVAKRLPQTEKS